MEGKWEFMHINSVFERNKQDFYAGLLSVHKFPLSAWLVPKRILGPGPKRCFQAKLAQKVIFGPGWPEKSFSGRLIGGWPETVYWGRIITPPGPKMCFGASCVTFLARKPILGPGPKMYFGTGILLIILRPGPGPCSLFVWSLVIHWHLKWTWYHYKFQHCSACKHTFPILLLRHKW